MTVLTFRPEFEIVNKCPEISAARVAATPCPKERPDGARIAALGFGGRATYHPSLVSPPVARFALVARSATALATLLRRTLRAGRRRGAFG